MSCITLLSDFGLHDASLAIAKGVLMQHTTLPLIDISHEVKPYNTRQAAYMLAATYKNFPEGTIHVLLFDMYAGKPPRLLLCEHEKQYFLTADNLMLPMTLGTAPAARLVAELHDDSTFIQWLTEAGKTIHKLQSSNTGLAALPAYQLKNAPPLAAAVATADSITCDVIHIDQYENVVLNIDKRRFDELRRGRNFRVCFMMVEEINDISLNYHDVREGYKLCRFNSAGYMEICINRGKAASLFGFRLGSKLNDIKIYFE